jgi:hypothetical protein
MTTTYHWTGFLRPGTEPNTVVCDFRDSLGLSAITITGTKVQGGYRLTGIPKPVPWDMKLPLVDEEG